MDKTDIRYESMQECRTEYQQVCVPVSKPGSTAMPGPALVVANQVSEDQLQECRQKHVEWCEHASNIKCLSSVMKRPYVLVVKQARAQGQYEEVNSIKLGDQTSAQVTLGDQLDEVEYNQSTGEFTCIINNQLQSRSKEQRYTLHDKIYNQAPYRISRDLEIAKSLITETQADIFTR